MDRARSRNMFIAGVVVAVALATFAPTVSAAAPGKGGGGNTPSGSGSGSSYAATQDPAWLAKKKAHLIRSGVARDQPKGGKPATPYSVCSTCGGGGSGANQLPTNNPVPGTWEPSDGNSPNFGSGSSIDDDYPRYYGADADFFGLCGPGAADIALWYWPNTPNLMTNNSVTDTAHTSTTTTWGSERMRGYMTYLAWQTQIPGYSHPGLMDNSTYKSWGTTLYGMRDGLNWEASGHASNWLSYFYAIQWNNTTSDVLLSDVVTDINNSHVPVVAEVDAQQLPNWTNKNNGTTTNHFITIIGYDNNQGIYYYTDTCGKSTNCGDQNKGSDGGVRTVPQWQMWNAITSIPLNTSTAPNAGDGGWVW